MSALNVSTVRKWFIPVNGNPKEKEKANFGDKSPVALNKDKINRLTLSLQLKEESL